MRMMISQIWDTSPKSRSANRGNVKMRLATYCAVGVFVTSYAPWKQEKAFVKG